jgi:3-oxoacyl-[acyl-carrier protein] reductase
MGKAYRVLPEQVKRGSADLQETMDKTAGLISLHGHTALVSGASGHIGQHIAELLAEAGAAIVVHGHQNKKAVQALAGNIQNAGGKALALTADLSQPEDAKTLLEDAKQAGFTPDILVNNAARQDVLALPEMDVAHWRAMFAATLDSAFALTQTFCKTLTLTERPGTVVNIASIEGLAAAKGHAHYASAKAAMLHFTRASALEYGPMNIRINAVSPGLIGRPGLEQDWPEGVARWKANAPLGRLGTANDVAQAVLYLCSPMADWVSGANLIVDGGMLSGPNW